MPDKPPHKIDNETEFDDQPGSSNEPKPPPLHWSVIAAGVVITLAVIVCLQVDDWSRDWTTNHAQTDPASTDENMRPLATDLSPVNMGRLVLDTMQARRQWKIVEHDLPGVDSPESPTVTIHLVHKTFLLGFKDDVIVRISPNETGSITTVTSQSRIGKGDLGQNPRNIRELMTILRKALP